ncbi:serine hydrolase domain-containing protein [Flectobacillus roseus]|uniref:Serine hydrolase domain-containing protein n=1 Tax=Flectobacillus roseus TaxID=502259 RepID=A0ABT6Y8E6_9BACT|nr:serine hydrolase domain-containing protein [Flectobacillus roseus]MDI9859782.1 serine hydrolase domain-containing protein [Flectobacillus roseus]
MKKLFFFYLFLFTITAFAQKPQQFTSGVAPEKVGMSTERLNRIEQLLNRKIAEKRIPGAVVLAARHGQLVLHKAYGMNDIETKKAQKTDDIFRIMSMTKAATSVAVMMLYEEGLFSLDDPISKYIPAFKNGQIVDQINPQDSTYTSHPAKKEITIRHLLSHTAGIPYQNALYGKAKIPYYFSTQNETIAETMNRLGALPKFHEPGEKFTYGLNTDVLGYFVEVISGMPFDQFLKKKIFEPLGMNDTGFYIDDAKKNRLVTVYEEIGKEKGITPKPRSPWTDYPISCERKYFSGGAGLTSTALDYAKLCQMLLNGGTFNNTRLLSRKTVELMTTNQIGELNIRDNTNKFGLGFEIYTQKGKASLPSSEGAFEWGCMYYTHYTIDPKEDLLLVVMFQVWPKKDGGIEKQVQQMIYQSIID